MRRPRTRAFGIALCSLAACSTSGFLSLSADGAGTPESVLRVEVSNCADDLASRLPAVVKLEIAVLWRERGETRSPSPTIAVRCEEEKAHIDVMLEAERRSSTIDLHALVTEHRARAVALAAAELVHAIAARSSAPEAPANPPLATPPSRALAERPEPTTSLPPARKLTLLAGGLVERRGNPMATFFGGRGALQYALGKVVIPELSVDASFGGITSRSASVAAKSVSTGAHLYFGTTTGNVRWDIGPGARFGWMFLAGEPDAGSGLQGGTLDAPWGGPELRVRIAYEPSQFRPALLAIQLGAGIVALPVRGLLDGTESVYATEGSWMSVCAEVGLGL